MTSNFNEAAGDNWEGMMLTSANLRSLGIRTRNIFKFRHLFPFQEKFLLDKYTMYYNTTLKGARTYTLSLGNRVDAPEPPRAPEAVYR